MDFDFSQGSTSEKVGRCPRASLAAWLVRGDQRNLVYQQFLRRVLEPMVVCWAASNRVRPGSNLSFFVVVFKWLVMGLKLGFASEPQKNTGKNNY